MPIIWRKENIVQKHKWYNEIVAWANGAEIEFKASNGSWVLVQSPAWDSELYEFRIKPQPKEPQYLYVMLEEGSAFIYSKQEFDELQDCIEEHGTYIGKIKLEQDE